MSKIDTNLEMCVNFWAQCDNFFFFEYDIATVKYLFLNLESISIEVGKNIISLAQNYTEDKNIHRCREARKMRDKQRFTCVIYINISPEVEYKYSIHDKRRILTLTKER